MKRRKRLSYAKYGYMFSIPFVVAFLLFSLYPTLYTVVIGFMGAKGIDNALWTSLDNPFQNYITILNNKSFQQSVGNTIWIWVMNFIPQILLALLLTAWFTTRRTKLKGQGFFKVIFYMPNIITAATIAILFSSFFGYPVGPINDFLVTFGFADSPINFVIDKLASQITVAFIQFWMWYGYTMLILISGVLGISPDIFEAADIDGANTFQQFFGITLPNIRTILIYTLVTSLIGGLNMFDIPRLYLNGGPAGATTTASVFIYNQAFAGSYMYGRASAASMIMFVIIVLASLLLFYLMRDKDEAAANKLWKQNRKAQALADKTAGGRGLL
ncbi:MAG: sugar ABC transporter permease [Ruminococcus sp.]|jgi:multiple sugar transport system permease protein|nr:sugar ABC transporter permease [Ruminococcus sp.]